MTPLGRPVVPEVKNMSQTSSAVTASARASASPRGTSEPRRRNSAQERPPDPFGVMISVSDGSSASRSMPDVVVAEEAVVGDEQPRTAPAQDPRGLVALEPGVQRDEDGAGRHGAEGRRDEQAPVRRPHRDPVAALDAGRDHRRRRCAARRRPGRRTSTGRSPSMRASRSPNRAGGMEQRGRDGRRRAHRWQKSSLPSKRLVASI